ncbi:MAG: ATP-binding protein [Catalinimonas sp.]
MFLGSLSLRRFTHAGIDDALPARERRVVSLMNRFAVVAVGFFMTITVLDAFGGLTVNVPIDLANVVGFALPIWLHHRRRYQLARQYFVWFGLTMVTLVNLLYDVRGLPHLYYLVNVTLIILLFQRRAAVVLYFSLSLLSYALTQWYQWFHPPLLSIDPFVIRVAAVVTPVVVIFFLNVAMLLFFRRLNGDYEQQLLAQQEQISAQADQLRDRNVALEGTLSQLKETQAQLVQSERMASLGQLTAGIAHEINNPLNFITANVPALRQDVEELAEQVSTPNGTTAELREEIGLLLDGVAEGAARMQQIVRHLRSFSRLDEKARKVVKPQEGLESTLALVSPAWAGRVVVVKNYAADLPPVEVDPGQLNQVFLNLMTNAGLAMADGGTLTLTTRGAPGGVAIDIADTGTGMTAEVCARVFEPFFTTREVGSGTGLGLAVSYGIVQQHGGTLKVQSTPGQGSTFTIWLPGVS